MSGHRRRRREERGAAAVEFALVVPILLVLFFGIVNVGIVLTQQLSLSNSARQAARFAVVDVEGRTCGQIESEARNAAETIGMAPDDPTYALTGATGTCERPCAGSTGSTDLTVTLTYRSEFVVPLPIPGVPSGVDIDGEGVFRCEYN
jgi:Flp pilus assembly protein TadG